MSIGRERLGELLRQLVDSVPAVREEAAEIVCDWASSLSQGEMRILVRVLSAVAAVEKSPTVREAVLHAVAEVFDVSCADVHDIAPIFTIVASTLGPSEIEYVRGLRDDLAMVSGDVAIAVAPWVLDE